MYLTLILPSHAPAIIIKRNFGVTYYRVSWIFSPWRPSDSRTSRHAGTGGCPAGCRTRSWVWCRVPFGNPRAPSCRPSWTFPSTGRYKSQLHWLGKTANVLYIQTRKWKIPFSFVYLSVRKEVPFLSMDQNDNFSRYNWLSCIQPSFFG